MSERKTAEVQWQMETIFKDLSNENDLLLGKNPFCRGALKLLIKLNTYFKVDSELLEDYYNLRFIED